MENLFGDLSLVEIVWIIFFGIWLIIFAVKVRMYLLALPRMEFMLIYPTIQPDYRSDWSISMALLLLLIPFYTIIVLARFAIIRRHTPYYPIIRAISRILTIYLLSIIGMIFLTGLILEM